MVGENNETPQEQPATKAPAKDSGLAPNIAGALCYALGFISGIIFLLIEKDNKFVKFHAIQSILISVVAYAINFIVMGLLFSSMMTGGFALFGLLSSGLNVLFIVVWIMLMVKAYSNEEWQIPIIGKIAKDAASK